MNIEKIILLLVKLSGERLKGKTLLQKQMYFLSVLIDEDFGYRAHYYGPYSSVVDDNTVKLKVLGFVKEEPIYFGYNDSAGFERKTFEYSLTENGEKILQKYKQESPVEYKKISSFVKKLRNAGNFEDYVSLSIAAKTYYIINQIGKTTMNEIPGLAKTYGWNNISSDMIDKATSFLKNIKLVNVKPVY